MGSRDIFLLNMYALKPLTVCIFVVLALTFCAFLVILVNSHGLWFGKKNFALSLFVELDSLLAIKLASAWIKCIVVIFYLVSFSQLQATHYIFFLVPCAVILLLNKNVIEFLTHFVSIAIQLVGVFAANILCSYILQFELKLSYIFMYALVAIVLALYSIYVFISEIDFISVRRSVKIEQTTHKG